jgi:hypothetical protein
MKTRSNTASSLRITVSLTLFASLSLSACQQMPLVRVQETVPQDIANGSQVLMVKHRNKINNFLSDGYFEIGDYAITGIKKGGISSSSSQLGLYSQTSSKTDFRFSLNDAQTRWNVRCNVRAEGSVVRLFGVDGVSQKSSMNCEMHSDQGNATLNLMAEMDTPVGQLVINQTPYAIRAYSYGNPHPDRTRIPAIYGFRIDDGSGNQAAIELSDTPGRAWHNAAVKSEHKAAMTAGLAALLIRYGS